MNIDAHGLTLLVDAFGPFTVVIGLVIYLLVRFPPPPAAPAAPAPPPALDAELRQLREAVAALAASVDALRDLPEDQGKLADQVAGLSKQIATLNGLLMGRRGL